MGGGKHDLNGRQSDGEPLAQLVSRTLSIRGPGQANCDFSVFKSYTIREDFKAQFRFEVFNLTNTPLFDNLNTTFGSSSFGQITNQANYPRIVQLGVLHPTANALSMWFQNVTTRCRPRAR